MGKTTMKVALEVRNLDVSYNNNKVIKNLSMLIYDGETVAIIGRSGCGKSTLLRSICALQTPNNGDIFLFGQKIIQSGHPLFQEWEITRNMMMVPQNPTLLPYMNVFKNISTGIKLVFNLSKKEVRKITVEIADDLGLTEVLYRFPEELSGGQVQRVQLARALVLKPNILLLDEITSNIDPQTTSEVIQTLWKMRQILQNRNQTIVIVTHLLDFSSDFADRILFLHDGVIFEEGPSKTFFKEAEKHETKEFLKKEDYSSIRRQYQFSSDHGRNN